MRIVRLSLSAFLVFVGATAACSVKVTGISSDLPDGAVLDFPDGAFWFQADGGGRKDADLGPDASADAGAGADASAGADAGADADDNDAGEDSGPLVCTLPFADCTHSNTCQTNTSNDPRNCGACGNVCSSPNTSPSCGDGGCAYACVSGAFDCNGDPTDGCECAPGFDVASTSCAGTKCVLACDPGWSDCDGNVLDGCELPSSWDDANCGGCGVTCGTGTTCNDGACVGAGALVASEPAGVVGIAVDATAVYWIAAAPYGSSGCQGALRSAPIGGGKVTTLASAICASGGPVLDASNVYVSEDSWLPSFQAAIVGYRKTDGASTAAFSTTTIVIGPIVLDGGTFFFSGNASVAATTNYGIWSVVPGGKPAELATSSFVPAGLALTSTSVVFLDGIPGTPIAVRSVARTGAGGVKTLGTTNGGDDVATAQAGTTYVAEVGGLSIFDASGTKSSVPLVVPPFQTTGGSVLPVGTDVYLSTLSVSGERSYVAKLTGSAGSTVTPLASTQPFAPQGGSQLEQQVALAADATYLYFGDAVGVHRVAR